MKHRVILFVCTGNTCRSPMAEAALRHVLKQRRIGWYRVRSAGISAQEGAPMSENAKQALTEAQIPFDENFKAHRLDGELLKKAHAVICMTEAQKERLGGENVYSLFGLAGVEIPDPFGQGIEVYRLTLRHIRECLPRVVETCCPKFKEE